MKNILLPMASTLKSVFTPWTRFSATAIGGRGAAAWDSLMLKAMGDKSLADRLITYELRRTPELSWDEAVSRANERWERDLAR
jgi:hypothetical protein